MEADMEYRFLKIEKREDVAIIKISRPEVLNALNTEVLREMDKLIDEMEEDKSIRVIVFTGDGQKAFVVGADISEMSKFSPKGAEEFSELGQAVFNKIERMEKITICAVNGYAFGGGMEFMMACDFALIDEKVLIGQPEINLGLIPGFGGSQRLSRIVGEKKALEIIVTGRRISADEAVSLGLALKKCESGKVLEEAMKLVEEIAKKPFLAVLKAKRCIKEGLECDLMRGLEIEAKNFALLFDTEDAKEGISAFLEKRQPNFKGK